MIHFRLIPIVCSVLLIALFFSACKKSGGNPGGGAPGAFSVAIYAGNGNANFVNGPAASASFWYPSGLALDPSGNLYVIDLGNGLVRMVTPPGTGGGGGSGSGTGGGAGAGGTVSTVFDGLGSAGLVIETQNGPLSQYAIGLAYQNGNLYIGGDLVGTIANNTWSALNPGPDVDAGGTQTVFPGWAGKGMAVDAAGNYYVANGADNTVVAVYKSAPVIWEDFGSGYAGDVDGTWVLNTHDQPIPGDEPSFNYPTGVAVDPAGNIYVADYGNYKIRKINTQGVVSTFAGSGLAGSADGTGAAASFAGPVNIAIDSSLNLYVADLASLRKISTAGVVTTICNCISSPAGLAVDPAGQNFYISEFYTNVIEKVSLK